MMEPTTIKNSILVAFAAVGGFFVNLLGGWDIALACLVLIMAVDFVTGILLAAVFNKSPKTEGGKLSSSASFKGLAKKCAILLVVCVGAIADKLLGTTYIRSGIILFYIANEGLSVLENIALMGLDSPKFIRKILEVMKDKNDDKSE